MIHSYAICDRCEAENVEAVTLTSLKHALRKAEPRYQLDLCQPCARKLLDWVAANKDVP